MGDSSADSGRASKLARMLAAVACVGCLAPAAAESRIRDRDRDGLSDRFELRRSHTGIRRADTDRDGLRDGYEVRRAKTDPRRADTDRDGLKDGFELRRSHTHPRKPDTDSDGMSDGLELRLGRDPREPDLQPTPLEPSPDAQGDVDLADAAGLPDPPLPPPDRLAPDTSITTGPDATVNSGSVIFSYAATEPGSTFECRLDGGAWGACSSPKPYSSLANGSHTFGVRASDAAGNVDASPATRTWVIAAANPGPDPGENCMADPSVCGFPDVENTGVQPGVTLTSVSGEVTLSTAGQVYENKLVTGGITVAAPNVTIRNVKLVATDDYYGIRAFGWQNNVSGLLVEHVEIDLNNKTTLKGIAFDGYTARSVFFHNGSDCAHMGGNVTVEDSLCVSGPDADDDGWPDGNAFCNGPDHFDGFQSDGGNNITIRHNTIRNPCGQTSNILMSSNTNGISNVTIKDNLLAGGGYSLYCNAGPDVANETVTGNRFSKRFYATGGYWGPTAHCEDADVFSANVWDESGASL